MCSPTTAAAADNNTLVDNNDNDKSLAKRRRFVTQLAHPRLFGILVVLHLVAACAGFAPAVWVFVKQGRWYLNPITQPDAWGTDNHPTMKAHTVISVLWIALSLVQYVVTPALMLVRPSAQKNKNQIREVSAYPKNDQTWSRTLAILFHKVMGYAGAALLLAFAVNANYLALVNGVSGKIHYNLLALIVSTMMMWHLVRAVTAIRDKNRYQHIQEVCGLLAWTCFPGVIRGVGFLVPQYFFLPADCDVTSTSGAMMITFPLFIAGLWALRSAALGEPFRYTAGDYVFCYLLLGADIFLGLLDGTLYRCNPYGGWLEQIPGQPWTLKNW